MNKNYPCTTAFRQVTREELLRRDQRQRWPRLSPDAPIVPDGLQPCEGVEYGCGDSRCTDCYKPLAIA